MPYLSEEIRQNIVTVAGRYPNKQAATLPALHMVHDHYRYVDRHAVVEIAELLGLHPAEVQDTMTFYAFFKETPDAALGEDRVWVCRGLACMLRGAYDLLEECETHYSVHCGQRTKDGKLTLEYAECIGACDGAPAVLINDEHLHHATVEAIDQTLAVRA